MFTYFSLFNPLVFGICGVLPLSLALTYLMIQVNISAEPMQRSSHSAPTPTAGGLAFICVFWITYFAHFLLSSSSDPSLLYRFLPVYGLASLILAVISLRDDYKPLSYRFRLLTHIICVTLIISGGLQIQFPAFGLETNGWIAAIMTGFCLISIINGANFVDGLNGLLAGCFLISLIFNILVILPTNPLVIYFYASLFFSVLGFFIFNFPKARIFMGDIGSTFLGLTVGFCGLISQFYYPLPTDMAWVHKGFIYTLTPELFACSKQKGENGVRLATDPQLPEYTNLKKDYEATEYDHAQMMSPDENTCDKDAYRESFYFTNVMPMPKNLYKSLWEKLQQKERIKAKKYKKVKVFAGTVGRNWIIGADNNII
ncbi:MAG: hypothetical protein EBT45_06210, partial [Alphaproteobacteria bacterium]|nr:hypothetical protein [Alphaproteobacteria bacterium]